MIRLFIKWLITNEFSYNVTLQYYAENNLNYDLIRDWWILEIPELSSVDFNKPSICHINRASQRKRIGKLPYGTLTVRVKKGTNLFWMLIGGINSLAQSI